MLLPELHPTVGAKLQQYPRASSQIYGQLLRGREGQKKAEKRKGEGQQGYTGKAGK